MSGPWWEQFFDDDYAFLYGPALDPERTEREVAGVWSLLRLRGGARLLDLCCGDGRHAVPLHRRGARVTGVDVSAPLLRRAQARAEGVLGDGSGPLWIRADARAVPLRASFDAAVILFNSLGYGTDDDTLAMLRSARASLVPGGQLVAEVTHRDAVVRRARDGAEREWMDNAGTRVLTERWVDPVEGVQHAVFRFARGGRDHEKRFRHRLYTPGELSALARAAGLGELRVYGGYDRRAFSLDAPFLLLHARAA